MVKYDEIFKYIVGNFPRALAALVLNMPEVVVGESLSTELPTVQTHRSDIAFHIHLPGGEEAILHIEAQTDDSTRKPMHLRMLHYSSSLALKYEKNVYSAVLYFRPPAGRNDPGVYRHGNEQLGGKWFQYKVIRMYDLEGQDFLDPEAIGLLPFTALMKHPEDMTPEAWVEKCIETTLATDVDSNEQSTLLFALSLFGSIAHPKEFFEDPRLEAIMQESPFYESVMQRGIVRGREEGIELGEKRGEWRGARQTSIESTMNVFTHRFPNADANALKDMLEAIDDLDRLKQVNLNASIAESLQAFQESLNGV